MKIVVTGALGFIGSHLFNKLSADQYLSVSAWDNHSYAAQPKHIGGKPWRYVDMNNMESVRQAMAETKPHAIFHLAAESHVCRSIQGPGKFFNTNIMGTYNLLEAARQMCPGAKIIHVSTDEVFGEALDGAFTESTPYAPRSPYAASKAASDHIANSYRETYGMSVVVTNCSNNFGPHQNTEKLIPMVIKSIKMGLPITVHGDGTHVRDWLWVHDHVDALITILAKGTDNKYVIGGEMHLQNIDVVQKIIELMGGDQSMIRYTDGRPTDDKCYMVDPSRLKSIGWAPSKDNFMDNLKKTIESYETI